ncbi:MAG: hypothetical protein HYV63_24420 [Candidatus Schekmanbacteria bacterium]|nr:hypothetical protein [Candidatus Schekmanbacteria bacterium]
MVATESTGPPQAPRRGRRLLRTLAIAAIAIEVGYAVAATVVLNSDAMKERINKRPQKLKIEYAFAWSALPGWVHVREIAAEGASRRTRWQASLRSGSFLVDPLVLPARRFRPLLVRGSGLRFALEILPRSPLPQAAEPAIPDSDALAASASPAAGAPALPGPSGDEPPPSRWSVELSGARIRDIVEISVAGYRYAGGATLRADLDRAKQQLTLRDVVLELHGGRLTRGEELVASALRGVIGCTSDSFDPRRERGRRALPFLAMRADLAADVAGIGFLQGYLPPMKHLIELRGGAGKLTVHAQLNHGVFSRGSRLELQSRDLEMGFLDYSLQGSAGVALVTERGGERWGEGQLSVTFAELTLRRQGQDQPHVRGKGGALELAFSTPGTALAAGAPALASVRGRLDLPPAEVPDFRYYNLFIPEKIGLRILRGQGTVASHFEITDGNELKGAVTIAARGVSARFDELQITGDLSIQARIARGLLKARSFDLAGSRIELTNVSLDGDRPPSREAGDGPWSATVAIAGGCLEPGRPQVVRARVEVDMSDIRPVLALYAAFKDMAAWKERLLRRVLDVRDVKARGRVEITKVHAAFTGMQIHGGDWDLSGNVTVRKGAKQGQLMIEVGRLAMGLELAADRAKPRVRTASAELRRAIDSGLRAAAQTPRCSTSPPPPGAPSR